MSHDYDTAAGSSPDLTEDELTALHDLQLGIEHVYRAYGALLTFHHTVGHAMDRFAHAEQKLRDAGHDEWADDIRDRHLPAGAVDGMWTYELVDSFERDFLSELTDFESAVRDDLADGVSHVSERRQQAAWRERAGWSETGEE
jgi:hypothetical protein